MANNAPNTPKTPVGGLVLGSDPIQFNEGRKTVTLKVHNTGDRPIQVGSHFHFFEVNRALEFDRHAAYGMRLNISSTTAISWVMITAVMPMRRLMSWISLRMLRVVVGSRAEVASSHRSTLGLLARARAMAMRCFCPPESWAG